MSFELETDNPIVIRCSVSFEFRHHLPCNVGKVDFIFGLQVDFDVDNVQRRELVIVLGV